MNISAKIISDSIANGIRLVTLQLKAPKFIDAEFEKHRVISSNSSSDRAIPLERMLKQEPFLPSEVHLNQAGMQGGELMSDDEVAKFYQSLIELHGYTADILRQWNHVHKQHLNRYLLGFTWQSKVASGTEWDNFFALRDHEAAQPEIRELAIQMRKAMDESDPVELKHGVWHLPYVSWDTYQDDVTPLSLEDAIKCSVARCARVSYLNHDQSKPDIQKDIALADRLISMGHMSPTEHQGTPMEDINGTFMTRDVWEKGVTHMDKEGQMWSGNFRGWLQYRQL